MGGSNTILVYNANAVRDKLGRIVAVHRGVDKKTAKAIVNGHKMEARKAERAAKAADSQK